MVEHFAVRYVQLDATPFIQRLCIQLKKSTDSSEKDFCLKNVKLDT